MASPFLIIFIARSGSSAMMGDLQQHRNVKMRGEVFGEKFLPLTSQNDQTDENRIVFLRQFWARYKRSGQATIARGFKVQVNPGQPQFTAWDRLPAVMDEHHAKLIVIRRTNIVKQAVSA